MPTATTAGYTYTTPGGYKGLLGGDYDALQSSLQIPGANAANKAYQTGRTYLADTFGGKGLYGSSMHAKRAQDLTGQYADTLSNNAAQAAAQRYSLQAQDLQNQNNYGAKSAALVNANEQAYNQLAYQKERDTWDRFMRAFQMNLAAQNSGGGGGDSGGTNWGGIASGVGSLAGGLLSSIF